MAVMSALFIFFIVFMQQKFHYHCVIVFFLRLACDVHRYAQLPIHGRFRVGLPAR
jgi:hypothetical protein